MRIGQLHMDAQDKLRFEILGKSSIKYHLKANHEVEAKRWVWALNNAIRWGKDEAKADAKRQTQNTELLKQAKLGQIEQLHSKDAEAGAALADTSTNRSTFLDDLRGTPRPNDGYDDDDAATSVDMSIAGDDILRTVTSHGHGYAHADDASSVDVQQPVQRDAFLIAAQSAKLQLDLLEHMSVALRQQRLRSPNTPISEPAVTQALGSFEDAVSNLRGLIGDLNRIARDRESFWQNKLERETNVRRLWEDSMARVAKEQEDLENRIGESEDKRKRTRRALRDALEGQSGGRIESPAVVESDTPFFASRGQGGAMQPNTTGLGEPITQNRFRRKSTIADLTNLSDDDEDDDEEFFDAVDAGEVEVSHTMLSQTAVMPPPTAVPFMTAGPPRVNKTPSYVSEASHAREVVAPALVAHNSSAEVVVNAAPAHDKFVAQKEEHVQSKEELMKLSWRGYEDPVRKRLKMDADDRPKISLWVCTSPEPIPFPSLIFSISQCSYSALALKLNILTVNRVFSNQ